MKTDNVMFVQLCLLKLVTINISDTLAMPRPAA